MISLPDAPTVARDAAIVRMVNDGRYVPIIWTPVRSEWRGHVATMYVMSDALWLADRADGSDGFRVSVRYPTAQLIADILGANMLTPRVSDLIYRQAENTVRPCILTADKRELQFMARTSRMIKHHQCIERKRESRRGSISTVGKDWVITKRFETTRIHAKTLRPVAANYGWQDPQALYTRKTPDGTIRLWQNVSLWHDFGHVDYSQVVRLVAFQMTIDGKEHDFRDVVRSTELYGLVSDEGPLRYFRHPEIPEPNQTIA